ncbi:APC family permease [Alkalicoccus daliensis]|uniref:Amino acid/polyamine/organocation transporter, APC superfamily (TC 2.A.3) n=1 Tax=Alkalicoccus daliensis TaxID=745820 RepID=A0A1G9Z893_9BACI|nr:APC family permease [Alkalicoccus daliensis]SDN17808.1 amino acid/polyamine/organocation transporter, APC superfamily (TC 2.A.3) [Alkalicoccus daliensis]
MKQGNYEKNSITLPGAVGLGTGVMIGAGIFALLGQVAEITGYLFPLSFIVGGLITVFSAYGYAKMANAYPSAGGIGMFFAKAYGKGTVTGAAALLMAISMIINQALISRTFGTYSLQLFNIGSDSFLVPVLGVGLIIFAFLINLTKNQFIEKFISIISILKIIGIAAFALAALWVSNFTFDGVLTGSAPEHTSINFIASLALTILAFKGFTTITNNGAEIVNPHKNISRAIAISIAICAVIYFLITWAVSSNLSVAEIIEARDYSLAAAAEPALGELGVWFTIGIAILATISVIIASIFAVSRMTAMMTDMKLIPHKHFRLPGNLQQHMLVYVAAIAIILTVFFDLPRIATLGAIFYLSMDIMFHWGILTRLKDDINAKASIVISAIILDAVVLGAFLWYKITTDLLITIVSVTFVLLIFISEHFYLKKQPPEEEGSHSH